MVRERECALPAQYLKQQRAGVSSVIHHGEFVQVVEVTGKEWGRVGGEFGVVECEALRIDCMECKGARAVWKFCASIGM